MLNFIVDDINAVPEALRAHYHQRADGKWVLQVQGAVPQERLNEFRDNNVRLQQQLEAFKDIDPAKAKELIAMEAEIRSGKIKDGKTAEEIVNERTEAMRKAHEKQVADLTKERDVTTQKLARLTIADAAVDAATKLGLRSTAREDLVARVTSTFQLKDGQPTALDSNGQPIFGKGAEPLSIAEYVQDLTEKAAHLFEPSSGTGATGSKGGHGQGGNGAVVNPWKKETLNLTKQGEIYKKSPETARRMAAEAGTPMPG
jgi:hypothetical protein